MEPTRRKVERNRSLRSRRGHDETHQEKSADDLPPDFSARHCVDAWPTSRKVTSGLVEKSVCLLPSDFSARRVVMPWRIARRSGHLGGRLANSCPGQTLSPGHRDCMRQIPASLRIHFRPSGAPGRARNCRMENEHEEHRSGPDLDLIRLRRLLGFLPNGKGVGSRRSQGPSMRAPWPSAPRARLLGAWARFAPSC